MTRTLGDLLVEKMGVLEPVATQPPAGPSERVRSGWVTDVGLAPALSASRTDRVLWAVVPEEGVDPKLRAAAENGRQHAEAQLGALEFELQWVRRPRPGENPVDCVMLHPQMRGAAAKRRNGPGSLVWLDVDQTAEGVEATMLHELRHIWQQARRAGADDAEERDAEEFSVATQRRIYGGRTPAELREADERRREKEAQRRVREKVLAEVYGRRR